MASGNRIRQANRITGTEFRTVMAAVCTPVSVITALDGDRPHGTTVSAFASLSLEPPMVLVALDLGSDLLALVRRTGRFGLNVLSAAQSGLAEVFARKGADKFAGVRWTDDGGLPRLDATAGWLACEVDTLVPGELPPLTYHRRLYGTHTALADSR